MFASSRGRTGVAPPRDPSTGEPADPLTPLARAQGAEVGVRFDCVIPRLQTILAVWRLDLASELVFVGEPRP